MVEDASIEDEIAWFEGLGYSVVIHRHEIWAHRRLRVVKMQRGDDPVMIELIKPIAGEWSPHVSIDVVSWPKGVLVRHLGEPEDEGIEVGFAMSPAGNVVEMVKPKVVEVAA
jgi:hypothetical protein